MRIAMYTDRRHEQLCRPEGRNNRVGHDDIGHNYIGHNYIGNNYTGHKSIGP